MIDRLRRLLNREEEIKSSKEQGSMVVMKARNLLMDGGFVQIYEDESPNFVVYSRYGEDLFEVESDALDDWERKVEFRFFIKRLLDDGSVREAVHFIFSRRKVGSVVFGGTLLDVAGESIGLNRPLLKEEKESMVSVFLKSEVDTQKTTSVYDGLRNGMQEGEIIEWLASRQLDRF